MNDKQKKILLSVARDTVKSVIGGTSIRLCDCDDPDLHCCCGCFVTLHNGENLRGCIGQFVSEDPLIHLVAEMAKAASTDDPRFLDRPITVNELNHLHLEISVLSPLKRTNDPLSLRLGTDGIYIRRGCVSGCFLPQVAEETGWTREEFLSYCCSHKAGLAPNAWQDKRTEVYLFTAEVFGSHFNEI